MTTFDVSAFRRHAVSTFGAIGTAAPRDMIAAVR